MQMRQFCTIKSVFETGFGSLVELRDSVHKCQYKKEDDHIGFLMILGRTEDE